MRRVVGVAVAALWMAGLGGLAACTDSVSGPQASLITTVMVDDTAYHPADRLLSQEHLGEEYTRVTRFVDCSEGVWLDNGTHVSDYCPLEDGESNYLPTGTPIYRVLGVEPLEALAVEYAGEWQVLRPAGWQAPYR